MRPTNAFGNFLVSLLSASTAAGVAIPSARSESGSFAVHQARNENYAGRSGSLALARAYLKYGVVLPDSLKKAVAGVGDVAKRESGSVANDPTTNDNEYLVEVQIGTPAQTLKLDFDTGSSDLWVFSSQTPADDRSGHAYYQPADSSTSKQLSGETWSIEYEDGSTSSGDMYSDVVKVGGLTVSEQAVESAETVSSQFVSGTADGLLGLGFDSINTATPNKVKTWFDNISSQLTKDVFVADLRHDEPGTYYFGEIPSAASGVSYTSVDKSEGYWMFSTESNQATSEFSAIADTGTTLMLVSNSQLDNFYDQVESAYYSDSQGGVVFDCDADLPTYEFQIGSNVIQIPDSLVKFEEVGNGQCFGGIQGNQGLPFSIFGDVALKSSYVVFDRGDTQIGWVQKSQ